MKLAENDVGLIITGFAYVEKRGQLLPGKLGLIPETPLEKWKELVDKVHARGGKIAIQLVHGGINANPQHSPDGYLWGPSNLSDPNIPARTFKFYGKDQAVHIMGRHDIRKVVGLFQTAARRALECRFDAVQVIAGHAFIFNQFLSPRFNNRQDEYGGDIANRARFLLETLRAIKRVMGQKAALLVKMNGEDFPSGGVTAGETITLAKMVEAEGVDAIEVSGVVPSKLDIDVPEKEAYFRTPAEAVKKAVKVPVISVGGYRTPDVVYDAITNGNLDFIAMSRPLIVEPDLIKRWKGGDLARSKCISCNKCFTEGFKTYVYCREFNQPKFKLG